MNTVCYRNKHNDLIIGAQKGRVVCFFDKSTQGGFFIMPAECLVLTKGFIDQAIENGTFEPHISDVDPAQYDDAAAAFLKVAELLQGAVL